MAHLDVYKTWAQVFKAEPMRQAKAEEGQMLRYHVKMPSRLHPPGLDTSCSRPGARVGYAECSVASEELNALQKDCPEYSGQHRSLASYRSAVETPIFYIYSGCFPNKIY